MKVTIELNEKELEILYEVYGVESECVEEMQACLHMMIDKLVQPVSEREA